VSYDPATDLAGRYPGWIVEHAVLGWGIREALCRNSQVILLEARDSAAERRSSLAHAIAHLDLEHRSASGRVDSRQEREADVLAARRLIPLEALADTLRWTRDEAEMAAELLVDRETLTARLTCLSEGELAALKAHARLADAA
jgi:Zn-dependent peptidase ImmA (M78 family)